MTTLRHLEKLWNSKSFARLARELLAGRAEASLRLEQELHTPAATAALVLFRLDELNQSHTSLAGKLLRSILSAQESDGGWGDLIATALCVRALLLRNGEGVSVERGLQYLAALQQSQGSWPNVPIRRMSADGFITAFIVFALGHLPRVQRELRIQDAIGWLEMHEDSLDPEARRLWDYSATSRRQFTHRAIRRRR